MSEWVRELTLTLVAINHRSAEIENMSADIQPDNQISSHLPADITPHQPETQTLPAPLTPHPPSKQEVSWVKLPVTLHPRVSWACRRCRRINHTHQAADGRILTEDIRGRLWVEPRKLTAHQKADTTLGRRERWGCRAWRWDRLSLPCTQSCFDRSN